MSVFGFDAQTGAVSLQADGYENLAGEFLLCTGSWQVASSELEWVGCKSVYRGMEIDFSAAQMLQISLRNVSQKEIELKELSFCWRPDSFAKKLVAEDTLQMLRGEIPLFGAGVFQADRLPRDNQQSYGMTLYQTISTGCALLFGVIGKPTCGVSFKNEYADFHRQGAMGMAIVFDCACILRPGAELKCSEVLAYSGNEPLKLLDLYASEWKRRVPPLVAERKVGWNSWDYYGGAVTLDVIKENASKLPELFDKKSVVVVDDGWQQRWGDWVPTDWFPGGLKNMAETIESSGSLPGIWIAPYTMYAHCPFAFQNRDCLIKNRYGEPVREVYSSGPVVMLDPTAPKVVAYITETFARLKAAGFKYFKLDFTQALLSPDCVCWQDRSMTRMRMLQRSLEIIREAVGDDAYILCGTYPYEMLAGTVEAARIANDIHTFWSHIKQSASQLSCNYWMNKALFINDPDFLVVRSKTTCHHDEYPNYILTGKGKPLQEGEWWVRGREAQQAELLVWATLVIMSAGEIILSDRLNKLNGLGEDIVRKVGAYLADSAAVPMDLFTLRITPPSVWKAVKNSQTMLSFINWQEYPVSLPDKFLENYRWHEIWSGEEGQGTPQLQVAPRSARLYVIER